MHAAPGAYPWSHSVLDRVSVSGELRLSVARAASSRNSSDISVSKTLFVRARAAYRKILMLL